jgi:hypothetical protein
MFSSASSPSRPASSPAWKRCCRPATGSLSSDWDCSVDQGVREAQHRGSRGRRPCSNKLSK